MSLSEPVNHLVGLSLVLLLKVISLLFRTDDTNCVYIFEASEESNFAQLRPPASRNTFCRSTENVSSKL